MDFYKFGEISTKNTTSRNIADDIADFEYIFNIKVHNVDNFSLMDLKRISWAVVQVNKKNAILISSKGILDFQTWGIYTTKTHIVLPNSVIVLNN